MARACLRNLLIVAESHSLDVDRRFERGQEFADVQRVAFTGGGAAAGGGRSLLPDEGGGRELAAESWSRRGC